jgi:hypothetical protein
MSTSPVPRSLMLTKVERQNSCEQGDKPNLLHLVGADVVSTHDEDLVVLAKELL